MPSPGRNYRVAEELSDLTLAAALRHWLVGQSWRDVKKLVSSRHVMINGNLCVDPGRKLAAGDVVKVLPHPIAAPPTEHDVRVIYWDEHVVVVDKPSGITTTRHHEERRWPTRRKQLQPTLDEMLPGILAKIERGRRGHSQRLPVRAVHRLDRETSGVMIFARTAKAAKSLVEQFREHTTGRRYLAIVHGEVKAQTISTHLVRDRGDGRRGSTQDEGQGKEATTHVRPVERLGGYTLVECRLETGRTHQIRIHLAEAGHMVCGENVYHLPLHGKPVKDRSGAPRIALHAAELEFAHPVTGQRMHFDSPLPDDLKQLLKRLRRRS